MASNSEGRDAQSSGQPRAALESARDALRLINAVRDQRSAEAVSIGALELARRCTIAAIDDLLADEALWSRWAQEPVSWTDLAEAELQLAIAVSKTLVEVGHVPPPEKYVILSQAAYQLRQLARLGAGPPDGARLVTSHDLTAAAKVTLAWLRDELLEGPHLEPAEHPIQHQAHQKRWLRSVLEKAGRVLVHVVTAGAVAVTPATSATAASVACVSTSVVWGVAGNFAYDQVKESRNGQVTPSPVDRTTDVMSPPMMPSSSPFVALEELPQSGESSLEHRRQDLLDQIAGARQWTTTYRMTRLQQLIEQGAVSTAEAELVKAELERQRQLGR